MRNRLLVLAAFIIAVGALRAEAALITYDASTGLRPEEVGWTFHDEHNPSSDVVLDDDVLRLTSGLNNRAYWDVVVPLPGTAIDSGVFVHTVARVVDEYHSRYQKGPTVGTLVHSYSGQYSAVRCNVQMDKVLLLDDRFGVLVAEVSLDTTEFHDYRLELNREAFRLFIDGDLCAHGTVSLRPYPDEGFSAVFGDGTFASGSTVEFKSVAAGAIPEPSTLAIWSLLASLGLSVAWWRRRKQAA